MQEIWNTDVSRIVHDTKKNILIKTLKRKPLTKEWFRCYKNLQNRTPHIVKIIDRLDDHTYTMEYLEDMETDLYKLLEPHRSNVLTKTDYIRLFKCINQTWMASMALSSEWKDNRFFVNQDAHLKNIAVIKNKNGLHFKYLDADAWYIANGYHGIDAFYTSQLKIVLSMQRVIT